MEIFDKVELNSWGGTFEDGNGIIFPNKILIKGTNVLAFVFLDKNKLSKLIIENSSKEIIKSKGPKLETLIIDNVTYNIESEGEKQYLEITCCMEGFKRYFIDFSNRLISCISDGYMLSEAYYKTFDEWKAFLYFKGAKMSLEEQYGLFAELYVLGDLLKILKPNVAIEAWRGPFRELDFKFKNIEFEVKATLKNKHEHIINGIDQLLKQKEKLGLISFCLSKIDDNIGLSLPAIILEIENLLANEPALIVEFRIVLKEELKYDVIDEDFYRENQFVVNEIKYFDIDESFPVFTSKSLKEPLVENVSCISYAIDLTNLKADLYNIDYIEKVLNAN